MANFRPAGLSDDESNSDDYGFYDNPARSFQQTVPEHSARKKIEINLQDAIIHGKVKEMEKIVMFDLHNTVNLKLDSGWTPLMHACFHAQEKIVHFLLDKGADPNLHSDSVTPAMVTCSNSSANNDTILHIMSSLIKKGCLLNIGDKYGQTPLMRAISSGRVAVVQKLMDSGANIEMRDQQGWTAVFWAVHHNQPEILEMLIARGARLTEVDKSGRTLADIADTHEFSGIIEILDKHLKPPTDGRGDANGPFLLSEVTSWHDFYPGVKEKSEKINYLSEIPHLLYGMNCERLTPIIQQSGMDLRSFLLMNEDDMTRLGIDMPYERQRLRHGLQKFHTRGWKLNSVAGLYARKSENYGVIDCVTSLGSHLHQVYILEASLQYTVREYRRARAALRYEAADSPLRARLRAAARALRQHLHELRAQTENMKSQLVKINKNNPEPADYIKEKSVRDIALGYITEILVVCSIGCLVYSAKQYFPSFTKK